MSNVQFLPGYETVLFSDVFEDVSDFLYNYNNSGIPTTITSQNATILYYLLYAKYGNSPIANRDENQFKYKINSIIWQYGPTWEKRLSVQTTLRGLTLDDLVDNGQIHDLFDHDGTVANRLDSTVTTDQDTTNTGTTTNVKTGNVSDAHTGTIGNSGSDTYNNYAQAKTGQDIHNHAYNPETDPSSGTGELGFINEQHVDKFNDTTTTTGSISHANTQTNNNTDTTTFNNVQDQRTDNLAGTNDVTVTTGQSVSGSDTSDDENTKTLTRGKLEGYEKLLELLETDVTAEFLNKFAICFKKFVLPRTYLYVTEED